MMKRRSVGGSGEDTDAVVNRVVVAEGKTQQQHKQQRPRPAGESLSLRQRAPALLLRKLDEFEEKAQKIWAKAEADEENRKIWSKSSNSVIGISTSGPRAAGPVIDSPRPDKHRSTKRGQGEEQRSSLLPTLQTQQQQQQQQQQPQQYPDNPVSSSRNGKVNSRDQATKKEDANRILIPTKTGKEPPKKLYPKESPAILSGRFLPLGLAHPQIGLAGHQPHSQLSLAGHQPHSLPLYPLHQVAWSRLPPMTTEIAHIDVWKLAATADQRTRPPSAADQRSRSRERGRLDPDQRRRAQSKSPARRPTPRYLDPPAGGGEDSRFGRMFRDLGEAVRSRMGRRGESRPVISALDTTNPEISLKSNLKKAVNTASPNISSPTNNKHPSSANHVGGGGNNNNNNNSSLNNNAASAGGDNKKVHFNKFATVQMMA